MSRFAAVNVAVVAGLAVLGLLLGAGQAAAGGVVGDGSPASCTETALDAALAGGGLVTFNCGGPATIALTAPKTITADTEIRADGTLTLTGNFATRLFVVNSGASLTMDGLNLKRGYSNSGDGGGVVNHGTLHVRNSLFEENIVGASYSGGAIFSDGPVTIADSTFYLNAGGSGGALFANFANAQVTIAGTQFHANTAQNATTGYGGAIWMGSQAHLTFKQGTLSENIGKYGGAIYLSPGAVVTLTAGSGLLPIHFNRAVDSGGAIFSEGGTLTILGADLQSNQAPTATVAAGYGGAIASTGGGSLFLRDSTLMFNEGRFGGAVLVGTGFAGPGGGQAVIERVLFAQNLAGNTGGGLYTNNLDTTVIISDTSIVNNRALGAGGGLGRFNSTLEIHRSSFSLNQAPAGGGLYTAAGPAFSAGGYVKVRDTTFSTNTATGGEGGAVYNHGLLELYSVTLKDNNSGFFNVVGESNGRLRNSVLQNGGANCQGAAPSDDAYNFATDTTCAFATSQQGPGLDPMLAPLESDPLGPTNYHLPLAGSPLINTGWPGCSPGDQRRALRKGTCDIGAVEFEGLLPRVFVPLVVR